MSYKKETRPIYSYYDDFEYRTELFERHDTIEIEKERASLVLFYIQDNQSCVLVECSMNYFQLMFFGQTMEVNCIS